MSFLTTTRKNILWTLQFIFVAVVAVWLGGLAVYGIGQKIYPNGLPYINDIRCAMGIPSQTGGQESIQAEIERTKEKAKLREAELVKERLKVIAEGKKKRAQMERDHAAILAQREKKLKDTQDRERKLKAEQAKSAALIKRIKNLEGRWTNINLFKKKAFKGSYVTSGVAYPSLVQGKKYSRAWCYWEPQRKKIPINLSLGRTGILFGINWQKYSDDQLKKSGVSREELEAAKKLCQWPS